MAKRLRCGRFGFSGSHVNGVYNDLMRAELLAANIKGKRLTYRRPHSKELQA